MWKIVGFMTRRITVVGLALTLLTVGGAAAAPDFASLQVQPYQPPKPAPGFDLPGLDGRVTRLADLGAKLFSSTASSRARGWRSCW